MCWNLQSGSGALDFYSVYLYVKKTQPFCINFHLLPTFLTDTCQVLMEILANKLVFVLIDPDTLHYRSRLKILYLLVGVFLTDF